jgi:hypothetical protein
MPLPLSRSLYRQRGSGRAPPSAPQGVVELTNRLLFGGGSFASTAQELRASASSQQEGK